MSISTFKQKKKIKKVPSAMFKLDQMSDKFKSDKNGDLGIIKIKTKHEMETYLKTKPRAVNAKIQTKPM